MRILQELAVPWALYELFVRKGNKINAPEANKFLLRQFRKPIGEGVEYRVTWCLDTMGDDDLTLAQKKIRQEIDEDPEKRALAGALCSRNEVNPVIQEIGERRGFDSRGFEKRVRLGNRGTEVKPLKQCR